MTKRLLIIDGNSVGYAAHQAMKLHSGALQTQAIFGFLKTMRELAVEYPGYTAIVLWDGRAQWRFDLHPAYKSNREKTVEQAEERERYREQRPYIARLLKAIGVRQITAFDQEADDVAGFLVQKYRSSAEHIQLITGDEDWLQLVRPNVSWRDWRDDAKQINHKNFFAKTLYKTPLAFLEGKCFVGDTSDVIPPVGGIGKGTAPEFLAEWGSVRHFLAAVDSGAYVPKTRASKTAKTLHPEQHLASPEGRRAFMLNLRLMQLIKPMPLVPSMTENVRGEFNKEAFACLCEELAFVSVLKTLDRFVQPFQPQGSA